MLLYRRLNKIDGTITKNSTKIYVALLMSTIILLIIHFNFHHYRLFDSLIRRNVEPLPPLYIITSTYKRAEQVPELIRLGNTLKHVTNLFWIVVEDADQISDLIQKLLERLDVPFVYLVARMPVQYQQLLTKPRGVSNRNRGLEWLRANAVDGVFYFADDDNTYEIEIFKQMRYTKTVSMWPVGFVAKLFVSSPVVVNGKIIKYYDGYYDGWLGPRKYPIDMAGFAVNVRLLLNRPSATMPFQAGYEEDGFLRSLEPLKMTEIEPLASECTEILVWHTQTVKHQYTLEVDITEYNNTNIIKLMNTFEE